MSTTLFYFESFCDISKLSASLKLSSWSFQSKLLPPGSVIYVSREPLPTTSMDLWLIALSVFKDLALAAASLAVIGN